MDISVVLWVAFGSIVAVVFPVLKAYVKGQFKAVGMPKWLKKYAALGLFGIISAVIVLAVYFGANPTAAAPAWYAAFLLGFGSESAIEKLMTNAN